MELIAIAICVDKSKYGVYANKGYALEKKYVLSLFDPIPVETLQTNNGSLKIDNCQLCIESPEGVIIRRTPKLKKIIYISGELDGKVYDY